MTEKNKLASNVTAFLQGAQAYYGRSAAENFSMRMWMDCLELGMQSPIEHLLWIAVHAVCKTNSIDINPEPWRCGNEDREGLGFHFWPQFKLDTYRADFSARDVVHGIEKPVWIVECDGHEFHERTKAERQYEKKRDRFFTTRGYRMLRFTGSEIVKDPYAVAQEIIKAVCGDQDVDTPKGYWGD